MAASNIVRILAMAIGAVTCAASMTSGVARGLIDRLAELVLKYLSGVLLGLLGRI